MSTIAEANPALSKEWREMSQFDANLAWIGDATRRPTARSAGKG